MGLLNFLEKKVDLAKTKSVDVIIGDLSLDLSIKMLALYIATSYISETISKCEFKVYEYKKEAQNQLYYLLNVDPNVNDNASEFKSKLVDKLLYDGEVLIFTKNEQLFIADSFSHEKRGIKEDLFSNITVNNSSINKTYKASEIMYIKLHNKELKQYIDSMYDSYSTLLRYAIDNYKSSNVQKYKLELDRTKAGDKDFHETYETYIKKNIKEFLDNPKAVYPQFSGYNLTSLQSQYNSSNSTDIRELKKDVFDTISQALKIPISMMYGNMTNVEDIVNVFITFAIEPIAELISNEFSRKMNDYDNWLNGNYIKVNTSSIIHADIFKIADKVDKLISSGVYCIDELRSKIGEDKLSTDFSTQHWITKNYDKIENILNGESNLKGGDS